MGYPNYAAYSLENTMAKTSVNVRDFLMNLIKAYVPKADAETKAIEDFARKTQGPEFQLQAYDYFYYSAKMKKELLNVSDDEVKPYFNVDSVLLNGVFYAANRVYGLTFKQRDDIPLYHPDMKAFEVIDKDGKPIALFCCDYYRRPSKRGGAWMDGFTTVVPLSVVVPGWTVSRSRAVSAARCLLSLMCATTPRPPRACPR